MRNFSDTELLEKLSADDALAFEELYSRYSKRMFLYAINIFKKREACEDIVQNVFTDLWSKRKEANISNVRAYLFQSVKYQIFNQIRNQKISDEDLTRLNLIDASMDMSKRLELDELKQLINAEITKLPERCQQIFCLSRYEQKSNREIAMELDISIQAVKNQISKALKRIRQNLDPEAVVIYSLLICSQLYCI